MMTPEELNVKITEVEQRAKNNTHRIETIERRQEALTELTTTVGILATKQEAVEADVKEIKAGVNSLMEKPAKRWEGLVDKLLYVIAGAFLAWLVSGLPGV